MDNIIDVLWAYVDDNKFSFNKYHHQFWSTDAKETEEANNAKIALKNFLFATMDEVRFKYANHYAKFALDKHIDMGELDYLRKGLLRREVGGEISYLKHRDHSAHTLYNYILGWFLYEQNNILKKHILEHFKKRNNYEDITNFFAYLWPFLSIVHDIGYLFEGTLQPLSTFVQSDQIKMGVEVVTDFFNHHLWNVCGFNSLFERERLLKLVEIELPKIKDRSMGELAGSLRYLGNLEKIGDYLKKHHDSHGCPILDVIPGDSFSLWENHYKSIGIDSMAERIKWLEKIFYHFLDEGLSSGGLRMLDHGVCSGLLVLLNCTLYYNIFYRLYDLKELDAYDVGLKTRFIDGASIEEYDIYWWWSAIIWGTAATAIHNIQQLDEKILGEFKQSPLKIEEDPLAYLGILVDCIQEWDRSTTLRESVVGGTLPIQGKDVLIKMEDGKMTIDYKNKELADNVIKNLGRSLDGWDRIVEIIKD